MWACGACRAMGPGQIWCLLLLLTANCVSCRRLLDRDWGDSGDPSGLGGLVGARAFNGRPARAPSRTALTPEAAESTANAVFTGLYRPFGPADRRTYAAAETRPNNEIRDEPIRPRNRATTDVVQIPRAPNLGTGEEQMAVLSVGGLALAETNEGAEAASASDALAMNKGGKPGQTTMAASMLVSRPPVFRAFIPGRTRSFGVSSNQGVGSLAMSGAANGKVVLAQAESAVAMSQTQTSTADQWQGLPPEPRGRGRRLRALLRALAQPLAVRTHAHAAALLVAAAAADAAAQAQAMPGMAAAAADAVQAQAQPAAARAQTQPAATQAQAQPAAGQAHAHAAAVQAQTHAAAVQAQTHPAAARTQWHAPATQAQVQVAAV